MRHSAKKESFISYDIRHGIYRNMRPCSGGTMFPAPLRESSSQCRSTDTVANGNEEMMNIQVADLQYIEESGGFPLTFL
jgi:hypothetical protein